MVMKLIKPTPQAANRPAATPDAVLDQVQRVFHLLRLRTHESMRSIAGEAGLAPMEGRALGFFAQHPGATPSELALHAGRDKAQIARLIKSLLDQGLLAREADAEDRRSHRLSLTAEGQAMHQRLRRQRAAVGRRLIAGLGTAELAQLSALLARMQANLDAPGTER
jgi:DNA-binding MarR family transcriptional regulator